MGGKIEVDGYSTFEVMYHIGILDDGGFVEAQDASTFEPDGLYYFVENLTWQGHELLDAFRNETVWGQTKEIIKEKGGSFPLEVMKAVAIEAAKK